MDVGTSLCAKAPSHVTPRTNLVHVAQTTGAVHRDSDPPTLKGGASLNETDTVDNGNLSSRWESSVARSEYADGTQEKGTSPVGP